MRRYLNAARRYRWLLAAVLILVWGAGLVAATIEYSTTFESTASIWVLQASPELGQSSPNDPNVPTVQTAASQQAELLGQLLQTRSFLEDVVDRTSLSGALAASSDQDKYLDEVRKHFRVQALGTNLLTLSFAARDPHAGPEMVKAALAVRGQRVAQARVDATTALSTLYQKDYESAQAQALDAQRQLDEFNAGHKAPLGDVDQHLQAQLRLTLDLAQARLADLRGRIDRAQLAPALLDISGMEFQVVDQPREQSKPKGGERAALMLAAMGILGGLALAALLVVVGTLIAERAPAPVDRRRIRPTGVVATVPAARGDGEVAAHDVRATGSSA